MEFGVRQTVWVRDGDRFLQGLIVEVSGDVFSVKVVGYLDEQGNFKRHFGRAETVKATKGKLFANNPARLMR